MINQQVWSRGQKTARWMIVGEAPGREEAMRGRPFVGRSGQDQDAYLGRHGFHSASAYVTNVVKDYVDGNPDPTPTQVEFWTPVLEQEINEVRPLVILAVGRFAARWFLGDDVDMDLVHGIPHLAGHFDPSRRMRGGSEDCIIVPVIHPANGMYNSDKRAHIAWDYGQAAKAVDRRLRGMPVPIPTDDYEGQEEYEDVSGDDMAAILSEAMAGTPIALDTEGYPRNPWCFQITLLPGTGYVLRRSRKDFMRGIKAIEQAANRGAEFIIHNAMFDLEMMRAMGVELNRYPVWDSMYAAFLMRTEPQGLKPLAHRWLGMRMKEYLDVVGEAGRDKQVAYLLEVAERNWPKPEERVKKSNDGTARLYKPQPVNRRAEAIITAMFDDAKKEKTDPEKRWQKVDSQLREMVEREMGEFPVGTLDDVPLEEAVRYSARDTDATLRLYHVLRAELIRRNPKAPSLMNNGMELLPVFEEMQFNGMPASRKYFEELHENMELQMERLQSRISHRYLDDKPFNPASRQQVEMLMDDRGLKGVKKTKTGKISTGKKSIEHLRYVDEAIADVIDWRERSKIRDSFCEPILERIPASKDVDVVRCQILPTRVLTRRLAAKDPNLLAMPVRNELGVAVRDGYRCSGNEVFGSWDLSQVEMRYMAHLSGDRLLRERFDSGRDVHSETAADIFKIPLDQVDKMKHRYPAKRAGFGIITNITGSGLLDQLRMFGCEGWTEEACYQLVYDWLNIYSGVARFMDKCKREVHKNGVIYDEWGMPRFLPGVWSADPRARAEAERTASSHKIQGGAQGMIQNSMRWLKPHIRDMQDAGLNVKWVLQIHDEIILRFDEDLWDTMNDLVVEALTQHHGVKMTVPVEASGSMSKSWGKLK